MKEDKYLAKSELSSSYEIKDIREAKLILGIYQLEQNHRYNVITIGV